MTHSTSTSSPLDRVRLTSGALAWLARRTEWLLLEDGGMRIDARDGVAFVPWDHVESVRPGRADDAFVIVHSDGKRLAIPAEVIADRAMELAHAIAARAGLVWVKTESTRLPPIAVRPNDATKLEAAFRTWSRID